MTIPIVIAAFGTASREKKDSLVFTSHWRYESGNGETATGTGSGLLTRIHPEKVGDDTTGKNNDNAFPPFTQFDDNAV